MKELSTEQKAKRYDEAVGKAKDMLSYKEVRREDMEYLFPELAESEDEKIRESLLEYLHTLPNHYSHSGVCAPEWIAWLEKQGNLMKALQISNARIGELIEKNYYLKEKQGEQKPADKVEPKFRVGDWVCENEPNNYARFIQILEIVNVQGKERYRISRDIHNDEDIVEFDFVEKYYHKFDIQDAKDGDVLTYRDGQWVFIFKNMTDDATFKYHALISEKGFAINDSAYTALPSCIVPATKEQRDLLFQKMKEAGYEWDADKLELKKIEHKSTEEYNITGIGSKHAEGKLAEMIKELKPLEAILEEQGEQKPVEPQQDMLSQEKYAKAVDECIYGEQKPVESSDIKSVLLVHDEILNNLFERYKTSATFKTFIVNLQNWWNNTRRHLLSLNIKQKPAWSEEDEKIVTEIINDIECAKSINYHSSKENYEYRQNWLKSLKERYAWKPSEEQIKGIECAIKTLQHQLNVGDKRLNSLYDDLKKLRE